MHAVLVWSVKYAMWYLIQFSPFFKTFKTGEWWLILLFCCLYSGFNYVRQHYQYGYDHVHVHVLNKLPAPSNFNFTFSQCVMSDDSECKEVMEFVYGLVGKLQLTFFCGSQAQCGNYTSREALQQAKYHVEKRWSTVFIYCSICIAPYFSCSKVQFLSSATTAF